MATDIMQFVKEFIQNSQDKIVELAKTTLENEEKKAALDAFILDFVEKALKNMKLGWLGKIIINKWLLPHIPEFTQAIYDLLKIKLDELVKKKK